MALLHIVADYKAGDLAFSEVSSALQRHLPAAVSQQVTSVGSFETVATGFVLAQLGLQREELRAPDTFLFANCAPRRDRATPRRDNEGEWLLYGKLSNGVPFAVVNSGYSLSFMRDEIAELWSVNIPEGGSQFRSRDLFPPIVGKMMKGELDFRKSRLDPLEIVPPFPDKVVGYIDCFGNLKTTVREGDAATLDLHEGEKLQITINGITRPAIVARGSFNVQEGELALAPGSSGHGRRFWELFERGRSAERSFNFPRSGDGIELKRV